MTETTAIELGCPHLELTETEVLCKASNWGTSEGADTGEVKQHYGHLPHAMIVHCESLRHIECSTFQRIRQTEAREKQP